MSSPPEDLVHIFFEKEVYYILLLAPPTKVQYPVVDFHLLSHQHILNQRIQREWYMCKLLIHQAFPQTTLDISKILSAADQ